MTELKKTTKLAWRRFLATEAGQEGMLYLRENMPNIHKGESHAMAFDAGYSMGYVKALDTIPELVNIREPQSEGSVEND